MKKKTTITPVKEDNLKRLTVLGLFLLTVLLLSAASFFAGKDEIYQLLSIFKEEQQKEQLSSSMESSFKKHKPESIKALYATMYTAGNAKRLDTLIDTAKHAGANALVIDVKGSQGELIFDLLDARKLVQKLHDQNIYVIARVVVWTTAWPRLTLK